MSVGDRDPEADGGASTAAGAAAVLAAGGHDYGWFGGRANGLDESRSVAFPVHGVVVSGRLYGRSFMGTWRQSTGDGEVALELAPDFMAAEGWWRWPHGPARHRAFIRPRVASDRRHDG